jgi:hypothetical protein
MILTFPDELQPVHIKWVCVGHPMHFLLWCVDMYTLPGKPASHSIDTTSLSQLQSEAD